MGKENDSESSKKRRKSVSNSTATPAAAKEVDMYSVRVMFHFFK